MKNCHIYDGTLPFYLNKYLLYISLIAQHRALNVLALAIVPESIAMQIKRVKLHPELVIMSSKLLKQKNFWQGSPESQIILLACCAFRQCWPTQCIINAIIASLVQGEKYIKRPSMFCSSQGFHTVKRIINYAACACVLEAE